MSSAENSHDHRRAHGEAAQPDRPRVIAPPPLLYMGALGIGCALHLVYPVHLFPEIAARVCAAVTALAGAALGPGGLRVLRRAGTPVNPRQGTRALVTSGPYRISRNPLYLSLLCLYFCVAFLLDDLWPFVLALPLIALLDRGVIAREERYLERKFGEEYRRYCSRVRRWI